MRQPRTAWWLPPVTPTGAWRSSTGPGSRCSCWRTTAYPSRLRAVEVPPPVLFLHGAVASLDRLRSVAIVGTRRPTAMGRTLACRIAEAVGSHGATVVSGLALGIDAAAHATAVRCGTPTVAVIGGGHERLYPAGHRDLAAQNR